MNMFIHCFSNQEFEHDEIATNEGGAPFLKLILKKQKQKTFD